MVYNSKKDKETSKIVAKILEKNSTEQNKNMVAKLLATPEIQLANHMFIGRVFEDLKDFSQAVKHYKFAANEYTKEALESKDPYTNQAAIDAIKNLLRFNIAINKGTSSVKSIAHKQMISTKQSFVKHSLNLR